MLNTKRYTWRHDNIVNVIATSVSNKFEVFSDLPDMGATGGGTIPPALCLTKLKTDIVILDKFMKSMHIFELMMPLTMNIKQSHKEITLKYAPFITDITGYTYREDPEFAVPPFLVPHLGGVEKLPPGPGN